MEINETEIYKYLQEKNNTFYCEHISKVASDVAAILSRIPAMFSNYTGHDIGHSARVADYMVDLLPQPIENYNDTELVIMLYSAIFHDIGMAVPETEKELDISRQEEIRKLHHIRSEEFINTEYSDIEVFKIDNESSIDFRKLIAAIARSHCEDFSWIENNLSETECFGNDIVHPQFISGLLRLGDYLDFDSRRTPPCLFKFLHLSPISSTEWNKHFKISNYPKIDKEKNKIYFSGECEEPDIFIKILEYFAQIEKEIKNAKNLLSKNSDNYKLAIDGQISNQINHETFDSVDLQFSMDYLAISSLLMGENLYSDRKCALREVIQNSLDAVLLKKEIYKNEKIYYAPLIKIIYSDNDIIIQDNGIGMTDTDITNYFLNIGHSFYRSDDFKNLSIAYNPISHYGIGFLSSFLLSNSITVKTTSYKNPKVCNVLQLKKDSRFVIQKKEENNIPDSGTSIIFNRADFEKVFQTDKVVCEYVLKVFKDTGVKIIISVNGKEEVLNFEEKNIKNKIDISEYLNNVECSFSTFVMSFPENKIMFRGIKPIECPFESLDEYVYDSEYFPEMIVDHEDLAVGAENTNLSYSITRLLDDENCLHILDIYPLDYDESECFNQAQEILGDNEGAFEYLQNKYSILDPIRIYIQDESIFWDFEDFDIIDMESEIEGSDETSEFKKLLKNFLEKKKDYDVCTYLVRTNIKMAFVHNDLFSIITQNKEVSNYYHSNLFVKNVRIQYFNISIPTMLERFIIANSEINVFSESCYPDVTRSRMNDETCRKLGYAIGRAIYIFILKNAELNDEEKEFLKAFINQFYAYDSKNEFCKEIEL
ncbi:MAG: hypothetical protein HDR35_00310 [Treponema sp.]|nr:hypothetical protein [Treponema sp.]